LNQGVKMQDVSEDFEDRIKGDIRTPNRKVEIDWDLDDNYSDETHRVRVIEIERSIDEPLGSTRSAIADIVLDNSGDRYTPTN